jgi:hypothetical protein
VQAGELNKTLHPTQRRFLAAFGACGSITKAARWAKIHRHNHYLWMEDADYGKAFQVAEAHAIRTLEDEAVRRAHDGITKAVRYKGRIVGYEKEYSDSLLLALLKAGAPEKYRERSDHRLSDPHGKPLFDVAAVRAYMKSLDEK